MSSPIKIGLFGYGCVGQGVYTNVQKYFSKEIEVQKICIKRPEKERDIPRKLFTNEPAEIIENPDIDLVVEVTDQAAEATGIIAQSLEAGKDVVTANKVAVATSLQLLINLQKKTGRTLLYEGAVAAAIPVLRLLEGHYSHEPIHKLEGILNGTTNYLLSKMHLEGKSYEHALEEAHTNGFAESDPTLDLAGWDAAYKLVIMAAHAFGHVHTPDEVERQSFEDFLSSSYNHKQAVRCISSIHKKDFGNELAVNYQSISADSVFVPVKYETNAISLDTALGGASTLTGNGAGADPTASAVLADIFQWNKGFRYQYAKYEKNIAAMKNREAPV